MDKVFFFTGSLSKDVAEKDIKDEIPKKIWEMQSQFTPNIKLEEIELVDYAYVEAQPNKWMIHAQWKQK